MCRCVLVIGCVGTDVLVCVSYWMCRSGCRLLDLCGSIFKGVFVWVDGCSGLLDMWVWVFIAYLS